MIYRIRLHVFVNSVSHLPVAIFVLLALYPHTLTHIDNGVAENRILNKIMYFSRCLHILKLCILAAVKFYIFIKYMFVAPHVMCSEICSYTLPFSRIPNLLCVAWCTRV